MSRKEDLLVKALVTEASSVEFVIIGPTAGRDRVLARSANAGLDLIGRSTVIRSFDSEEVRSDGVWASRPLNVVESNPIPDSQPELDKRKSKMILVWSGVCARESRSTIEEAFRLHAVEIRKAIDEGNLEQFEWNVAPVVLECSVAKSKQERTQKALVTEASSVEFVIIGPTAGRDRVLARSANAGLDLIGRSTVIRSFDSEEVRSDGVWASRPLNVVESNPIPDSQPELDKRKSKMILVWSGVCARESRSTIEEAFRLHAVEIRKAIDEGNLEQFEWNVAPVVLECSVAKSKQERTQKIKRLMFGAYFALLFMATLGFMMSQLP